MKGRDVPPAALYPGYELMRSEYWVEQHGDEEFLEEQKAPYQPYLLLRSQPQEGSNDDPWEMTIPYDQLDEVITVLTEARKLQPPAPSWERDKKGRWVPRCRPAPGGPRP